MEYCTCSFLIGSMAWNSSLDQTQYWILIETEIVNMQDLKHILKCYVY